MLLFLSICQFSCNMFSLVSSWFIYLCMSLFMSTLTGLSRHCQKGSNRLKQIEKIIAGCQQQQPPATVSQLSLLTVKECNEAGASDSVDRTSGNHLWFKLNSEGHLFFIFLPVQNPQGSALHQPGLILIHRQQLPPYWQFVWDYFWGAWHWNHRQFFKMKLVWTVWL